MTKLAIRAHYGLQHLLDASLFAGLLYMEAGE